MLAALSPVAICRPTGFGLDPMVFGLELQLALGVQVANFEESHTDIYDPSIIDDTGCGHVGARAAFRVGYTSPMGPGVAFHTSAATLGICHIATFVGEVTF